MKGERLSWKEQWVLSEVIWSAFDFSEPSEHFPAIIYLLYASTFNTPDAPREMWGDLFMWKWCRVMIQMKAVCKGNDSLVCLPNLKTVHEGSGGVDFVHVAHRNKETPEAEEEKRREHQTTRVFLQKALVVHSSKLKCLHLFLDVHFCVFPLKYRVESVRFGPGCGLVIDRWGY